MHKTNLNYLVLLLTIVVSSISSCKKDYSTKDSPLSPVSVFNLNRLDGIYFTKDNGSIITGVKDLKYTMIRTNGNMSVTWTRNDYDWGNLFSGSGWGAAFYSFKMVKVFERDNGSFVCVGTIQQGGDVVYSSTLILLLDQQGTQLQKNTINDQSTTNAIQTSDGGYLIFGNQLIKLDADLNFQWKKDILDQNYSQIQVTGTSDGGFATTGSFKGDQVFLKKYDAKGNELASFTYKSTNYPSEDAGFDLTQLSDNGFMIIGRAGNPDATNNTECQMIRTGPGGDTLWTKRFDFPENSWLEQFVSKNNNEFVILGSIGFPNESQKSLLLKVNLFGQITDSLSTPRFQNMVYSPSSRYLKVKQTMTDHVEISTIYPDFLFLMTNEK